MNGCRIVFFTFFVHGVVILFSPHVGAIEAWPAFRGPAGDGIVPQFDRPSHTVVVNFECHLANRTSGRRLVLASRFWRQSIRHGGDS